MKTWVLTMAAALLLAGSGAASAQAPEAKPTAAGGLGLNQLALMDRVSDPRLSPDARRVLYNVRATDWAGNRGAPALWVIEANGSRRRLAISDGAANSGRWAPDGSIYFLSSRGGSSQVWRADRDGQAAIQLTTLPVDVTHFRIAPDGKSLVLALPVFLDCPDLACTRDRLKAQADSKSTVRAYDRLPLRPWDAWNDGRRSHLFVQALNGSGLAEGAPRDLTPGFDGDVPSRPLGGDDAFVISPDGRHVVFQAQNQGRTEALTDNADMFRVALSGGPPANLTQANSAADYAPAFSPDGRRLAWLAGRRENVGGDQPQILVADADGANPRAIAADWDRGPGSLKWSADGRALYATAAENGQQKLFRIEARSGAVTAVSGDGTVAGFDEVKGRLVLAHESFQGPTQIVEGGRALTDHNAKSLAGLALPKGEPSPSPAGTASRSRAGCSSRRAMWRASAMRWST